MPSFLFINVDLPSVLCCSSDSYFGKVLVPVPATVPIPAPFPVLVPDPDLFSTVFSNKKIFNKTLPFQC